MSFIRCRAIVPRPLVFGKSVVSAPRWAPTRHIQTRGVQNRPRDPSTASPQHPSPSSIVDEAQHAASRQHKQYFQEGQEEPEIPKAKVKFLVPTVWALAVSTGIYASLAYYTAKKEIEDTGIYKRFVPSAPAFGYGTRTPPTPTEVVTRAWRETDPISKLTWSLIGFSGSVHLLGKVAPMPWWNLWHVAASGRNYTLLTSTFVHAGAMHLGVNAYAMYNLLPPVGYSPLFRGDTNHMLSFFLATGVISGLAQHVASAIFTYGRPLSPFIPGGGASGALFAVLGAYCTQYPTSGVGIILIPYYLEAQYVLPAIMLFDLVGMVRGFSFANLGHGAHLGGACLGVAYASLDGYTNVWRPTVDFWKRRLKNK